MPQKKSKICASCSLQRIWLLLLFSACGEAIPEMQPPPDGPTMSGACTRADFDDGTPHPMSIESGSFTYPKVGCLDGAGCARNNPTGGGHYLTHAYSQPQEGTFGLRVRIYPEAGWPAAFAGPKLVMRCDNGNDLRVELWSPTQAYFQQNSARITMDHKSPEEGWTDVLLLLDKANHTLTYYENGAVVHSQTLSAGCRVGISSILIGVGVVDGYQAGFRFDSVKAGPPSCY